MKKTLLFSGIIFLSQLFSAQTKLDQIYKVELGLQGISVGSEIPISNKFLVDVNIGYGGIIDFWSNGISYEWTNNSNSMFARGQLRYYISRERREEKGHSLKNNAGTFVAFQSKYLFSGTKIEAVGKSWLNELQFGQQLPIGSHIIFRYYGGVGNAADLDNKLNKVYPALGFAFGYAF
ncbi:hypothetical protein [Soonwooa sp.]|uniref:hypothetical protein n=1 Tax=Soonwooa sp. TaxID=1938592 RepID=UPI002617D742|nr:hypothetical protein [Soonwooa sp.]